jgi:hypothetical protein
MAPRSAVRVFVLALVLPALSACSMLEGPQNRAIERSPNFKDGYSDGCETANAGTADMNEHNVYRDEGLYQTDRAYRTGWGAGYTACAPARTPTLPQQDPIPDPSPNGN